MEINLLLFTLTDPALENIAASHLENECKYLFEMGYQNYTKDRIKLNERMRDDESFRFIFEENLMYLTKDYYVRSLSSSYFSLGSLPGQ